MNNSTIRFLCLTISTICLCTSCDPVSILEGNIKNATTDKISIVFVSSEFLDTAQVFTIEPNETLLFFDALSTSGAFLKPSFEEYDSVYLKDESDQTLKIYKPNTTGKNIYHIDDYWIFSEPSKRFYQYDYEITSDDIE